MSENENIWRKVIAGAEQFLRVSLVLLLWAVLLAMLLGGAAWP